MQSAEATARMKGSTPETSENLPEATTGEEISRKQRKMADRNVFEGGGNINRCLSSCGTEDRFSPSDLVGLAVGHADAGRWLECLDTLKMAREAYRAARSGMLSRTNEILLGGGEGLFSFGGGRGVYS